MTKTSSSIAIVGDRVIFNLGGLRILNGGYATNHSFLVMTQPCLVSQSNCRLLISKLKDQG